MRVVIRNFRKNLFSGFLKRVILPGEDGELAVWDFHQTMVICLKAGDITLVFDDERSKKLAVKRGVAKFHRNELIVLCL